MVNLELSCLLNKVQVRKSNTTSLLTIVLIERHVLACSEAIIRFYDC